MSRRVPFCRRHCCVSSANRYPASAACCSAITLADLVSRLATSEPCLLGCVLQLSVQIGFLVCERLSKAQWMRVR